MLHLNTLQISLNHIKSILVSTYMMWRYQKTIETILNHTKQNLYTQAHVFGVKLQGHSLEIFLFWIRPSNNCIYLCMYLEHNYQNTPNIIQKIGCSRKHNFQDIYGRSSFQTNLPCKLQRNKCISVNTVYKHDTQTLIHNYSFNDWNAFTEIYINLERQLPGLWITFSNFYRYMWKSQVKREW